MTVIRLSLTALLFLGYPLSALAQTPAAAAPTPATAVQTKPELNTLSTAERKAKKKEEIAREKAAVRTPLDARAALETRMQIKEKRAACKQEAKAKRLGFMARRTFVKGCEAG